jgi:hypothetical protein
MKKRGLFVGMLGLALAFGLLAGCTTAGVKQRDEGTVYNIGVPAAKNVEILGLVHIETEVDSNGNGESITYDALLKEAEKLGGNGIVNILIDKKAEEKKLFGRTIGAGQTTWFGSALAIKYTDENLVAVPETVTAPITGRVTATGGKDKKTTVLAQDAKKNWISGNVGILGGGAQYERVLTPYLSIGAGAYYYTLILFANMGGEANVRFYPLTFVSAIAENSILRGFYVDAGLGFGLSWGAVDFDYEYEFFGTTYKGTESEWGTTTGFLIRPGLGWKFDVGKPGGFFLEPHVAVPIVLGNQEPVLWGFGGDAKSQFGASVGFIARFGLGFAF